MASEETALGLDAEPVPLTGRIDRDAISVARATSAASNRSGLPDSLSPSTSAQPARTSRASIPTQPVMLFRRPLPCPCPSWRTRLQTGRRGVWRRVGPRARSITANPRTARRRRMEPRRQKVKRDAAAARETSRPPPQRSDGKTPAALRFGGALQAGWARSPCVRAGPCAVDPSRRTPDDRPRRRLTRPDTSALHASVGGIGTLSLGKPATVVLRARHT